jgi:hypothetical protein
MTQWKFDGNFGKYYKDPKDTKTRKWSKGLVHLDERERRNAQREVTQRAVYEQFKTWLEEFQGTPTTPMVEDKLEELRAASIITYGLIDVAPK